MNGEEFDLVSSDEWGGVLGGYKTLIWSLPAFDSLASFSTLI
jgi:hypothetical protein